MGNEGEGDRFSVRTSRADWGVGLAPARLKPLLSLHKSCGLDDGVGFQPTFAN
jgi:hypothetical protein